MAPLAETGLCYVDDAENVAACFPLMHQLRPHIASPQEFVERWRRQTAAGYRLVVLSHDGKPVALAGFRVQDNMIHGPHFYVDDLVTDETARGGGHGGVLMNRLKQEARALGCSKFVLDTPLTNSLGHRFYFRQGLLAVALRFSTTLT